jgi:hypothetical protein
MFPSSQDGPNFAAALPGVPLEPVVEIIVAAPPRRPEARDQISRDEQAAPALDLPHVHLFVLAAGVEAPWVAADDDVAERHRRGTHDRPFEEPACESAVEFERP